MNDFEEKVKSLNEKIKATKQKKENKANQPEKISRGMNIIIELVSGPIVGAALGVFLDKIFDFKFVFLLTLTVLGGFAGMLNVSNYLKKQDESIKKEE